MNLFYFFYSTCHNHFLKSSRVSAAPSNYSRERGSLRVGTVLVLFTTVSSLPHAGPDTQCVYCSSLNEWISTVCLGREDGRQFEETMAKSKTGKQEKCFKLQWSKQYQEEKRFCDGNFTLDCGGLWPLDEMILLLPGGNRNVFNKVDIIIHSFKKIKREEYNIVG